MQRYIDSFTDTRGNAVSDATITVTNLAGAIASLYSDNGVTRTANPFVTDNLGTVAFYAADGRYNLKCEKEGIDTRILSDVILTDAAALPTALAAPDGSTKVGGTWFGGVVASVSALAASTGASLLGFIQSGTGAVARSLQDKAREIVTFADRGATGSGDATSALQSAFTTGYGAGGDASYQISAPVKIPSLSRFIGTRAGTAFTGSVANVKRSIHKTNNATVVVTNFQTSAASTIDCIAYIDPAWIDAGVSYPQKIVLESLAFDGNTASPNTTGLYIEQGGGFTFRDLDFSHVTNAIYAKECWLTNIDRVHALASFVWKGGTSITMNNCLTGAGAGSNGGYDFTSTIYSAMNSCGADGATNTAYRFSYSKFTLNSCGCEGSTTATGNSGTAIAFDASNDIVLNNFNVVPLANQVLPIFTCGANNNITFHQGSSSFGVTGINCPDIYIFGNGSTVVFHDYTFWQGLKSAPVIQFASGITTSKVIVKYGTDTKIYTSDGAGATVVESLIDSGSFTPTLKFGGASVGMTYATQSGNWQKNGKNITGNGRVALSAKGSSTGVATLSGWTLPAPVGDVLIQFGLETGISAGPLIGTIDAGSSSCTISARTATGDAAATEANFGNSSVLRFTFSYTTA